MVNKISFLIIGILVYLYICIYTFNHINAWIGWLLIIIAIIYALNRIFKTTKK